MCAWQRECCKGPDIWPRQSLVSAWWKWKVMLSYGWQGRHINVHEMIAVLQIWKLRSRNSKEIGKGLLHAMDSQ
eukprot:11198259-Karenia_brevis.AAC.1